MNVQIIADSACDLPTDIIKAYNIEVFPLMVYIEGEEFEDGDTPHISKKLYDHMRDGGTVKTAQVPYERIYKTFTKYAEKESECIYIGFSSELSGTYQTACLAAEDLKETYPDFEITCIDSLGASIGFGLTVHKAASMAKDGCSKQEILDMIAFYKEHMEHIFTVDALEYLYRGGRVSRASAFVGDILKIKPILHVKDGKLIPIQKIRGRKKSLKRMIEIAGERGEGLGEQVIAINHAADPKTAQYIKERMEELYGVKSFIIREVGAVIGSHSGPGTASIFFLNKLPKDDYLKNN